MTMAPDPRVIRMFNDDGTMTPAQPLDAERVASHIHAASVYTALHDDAERLSDGMGAAAWAAGAIMAGLAVLLVWVFLF